MARAFAGLVRFLIGLACGLAIGYAAAQLLAPAEGVETRRRLEREADALRERPRKVASDAQARIHHAFEEGRRAADEARAELEAQTGLARPHPVEAPCAHPGKAPM